MKMTNLSDARKFIMAHSSDAGRFPMGRHKKPTWPKDVRAMWDASWATVNNRTDEFTGINLAERRNIREEINAALRRILATKP